MLCALDVFTQSFLCSIRALIVSIFLFIRSQVVYCCKDYLRWRIKCACRQVQIDTPAFTYFRYILIAIDTYTSWLYCIYVWLWNGTYFTLYTTSEAWKCMWPLWGEQPFTFGEANRPFQWLPSKHLNGICQESIISIIDRFGTFSMYISRKILRNFYTYCSKYAFFLRWSIIKSYKCFTSN